MATINIPPTTVDAKIAAFTAGRPWLKIVLTLAMTALGIAKGRGWFALRYGLL